VLSRIEQTVELTYSFFKRLDATSPMAENVYDTPSRLSLLPVSNSLVDSSKESKM
jgi:hypothetical protein